MSKKYLEIIKSTLARDNKFKEEGLRLGVLKWSWTMERNGIAISNTPILNPSFPKSPPKKKTRSHYKRSESWLFGSFLK